LARWVSGSVSSPSLRDKQTDTHHYAHRRRIVGEGLCDHPPEFGYYEIKSRCYHPPRTAKETFTTLPQDADPLDRQRARYEALKAARDRALVFVLAYTAVRVGELLRDPNDPRRRGVRWEEISLDDWSMDVYRKKQQWDAASLPDPVMSPLRSYRKLMDPPTERWSVFPTFDQRTLATLLKDELADRGLRSETIDEQRDEYVRDLLLALAENIRPPSITTDGARSILQRLSEDGEVDIDHPKHDYLAPHGGRRGMGEVLVRAFGYTVAARYLDNSEEMVRERYSHIEAGELGDVATEALEEIDSLLD
jgi:integrase